MTEKPENRKTITIKINGKDRPFQNNESQPKADTQQDAFVNNKDSMVPKNSAEEVAAGSEALEDESFDWILPNSSDEESDDIKEFQLQTDKDKKQNMLLKKKQKGSKRNLSKGMVVSIFFAVFFAIVLGTGFGFVLLKMVDTDKTAIAGNNSTAPAQTEGGDSSSNEPASGSVEATKEEISTFVVQNNIYTTEEAADKEIDELINKGIFAQKVAVDGKYAIYLGVTADIDSAKELKTDIEKDGEKPFAKEMIFPGGEAGNVSEAEKQFLDAAPEIYSAASAALTSAYAGSPIQEETAKKLVEQQKLLNDLKVSGFKDESIKKAAEGLTAGVNGAAVLEQDSGAANQETVQKSLLAFLANYVEIGS